MMFFVGVVVGIGVGILSVIVTLLAVADYIDCPSEKDCDYDGQDGTCCVECKTRWLQKEWDE